MARLNEYTGFQASPVWKSFGSATVIGALVVSLLATPCNAQDNESPKQEKSAQDLRLEFASLSLKLAETEMKLAEQVNREIEESMPSAITGIERQHILNMKRISTTSIERLKSNVAIAEAQLALANSPSTGNPEKLQLRFAEEKIRLAKVKLDAIKADKSRGIPVPDLMVVRQDLKYQMAKLDRELLGNPEHLLTLVDSLQRQINQLREDVMRQDQRITAVEDQDVIADR